MPVRPWSYLTSVLALAAVYFGAAELGLSLALPQAEQVTVIWPPSGIALAALLLFGYRLWPGVALGAFLANALAHEPSWVAVGIATGNTLEAVVGAWLLHSLVGFRISLDRVRDVLGLMVLAAGVSTMVSAAVGVASLCLGGVHRWEEFRFLWWHWWLGDATGDLLVAPLLLTWAIGPHSDWPSRKTAEAAALLFGLGVVSTAVFTGAGPRREAGHPLEYTIFPFVVWAALRFGQRGAAAVTFAASAVAVFGTVHGLGPFAAGPADQSLVQLQFYMAVVAGTALLFEQQAVTERQTAERRRAVGYAATAALAESPSLTEAAPRLLRVICEHLDWDVGTLWTVDRPAEVMRCVAVWHSPTEASADFATECQARTFPPGVGLPGRIWSRGQACWIVDVTRDTNFPRAAAAAHAGLHGAFGLPILLGPETLGVIEFFSHRLQPPDDDLLRLLASVGSQVGLFIEHTRAQEASAKLAAIVESSDDAIVSKDLNGVIATWNAGAERIFGYAAAEAVGRPITMLLPANRLDEERMILEKLRRGERIDHFETARVTKNGRQVEVSITISPLRDSTGQVVGASNISRDITGQKRLEEQLRLQAAELAEANRRKDEFLAMLAHELRNPLAPIRNALHILKVSAADTAKVGPARDMLERQVQHLVRLVDDLLDVSRVMRGRIELRKERIDLAAAVARAVETAQPAIAAGGHELTVALPQEPVEMEADPVRLAQVVANLLNNAAKYTESGGRIALSAEREGGNAVVRVRDTGIGIAADMLPHIFDLFVQADHSLDRAQGGLGIGLTLVRSLVELHGGRIEAHSGGPGQGSEFVVWLPLLCDQASRERERPEDLNSQAPVAHAPGSPLRRHVLVVDDNVDAADSLAALLRLEGHTVRVAHNGANALAAAAAEPPEVVFLDIGMPGMDGLEVARRLRPALPDVVLVAVTGWGQDEDRRRTKDAGFDRHVVKPVELEELRRLLTGVRAI